MSAKTGYERGEDIATRSAPGIATYPNPDDPMPPGPWDPVIRAAIERAGYLFRSLEPRPYARQWEIGAFPQPWKTFEHGLLSDPHRLGSFPGSYPQPLRAYEHGPLPDPYRLGPLPDPWSFYGARYAELNPQPLPPIETRSYIQAVTLAREILERAEYLQQSIEAARTEGATQGEELPRAFVMGFAKHFAANLSALPVDPFGGFDYGRPPKPNWLQAVLIGCLLKSASTFDTTHAKLRLVLEEAGNLLVNAGLSKQPGAESKASH